MIHFNKNLYPYYNLGRIYTEQKNYPDAEIQYKKVLELDANHINTLNYLGLIYYYTTKYVKAEQYFKKIINLDPNYKYARYNLGNVYYVQKDSKISNEIFSIASNYDFNDTYLKELSNFIGIINGENTTKVTMKHVVDVMKVLETIKISSEKEKYIYLKDII